MLIDEIKKLLPKGGVSFAEMSRIDGFNGTLSMCLGGNENVILWSDMSQEAIEAIKQILDEGEYKMVPTQAMVYWIDGLVPSLPTVKRNMVYKTLHWLPVSFNPVKKRKLSR